jgi:hypothetical protein
MTIWGGQGFEFRPADQLPWLRFQSTQSHDALVSNPAGCSRITVFETRSDQHDWPTTISIIPGTKTDCPDRFYAFILSLYRQIGIPRKVPVNRSRHFLWYLSKFIINYHSQIQSFITHPAEKSSLNKTTHEHISLQIRDVSGKKRTVLRS